MVNWATLADERLELFSPVGFRLIDAFTGRPPIGSTKVELDIQDAAGWRPTHIVAGRSASGIIIFPRLGRRADPVGAPPEKYRIRISADFYRSYYRRTADGIEFNAYPYNDRNPPTDYTVNPPVVIKPQVLDETLIPAVNYPFPTYVRVVRGEVVDAAGDPVLDVEVKRSNTELALTQERGAYALPLRSTANGITVPIDATDHRTGRMRTINITLPAALGRNQRIPLP